MFVGSATHAATRELAVNHDGRHAANAVLLSFRSDGRLLHIMHGDVMRGARQPFDDLDVFLHFAQPALKTSIFVLAAMSSRRRSLRFFSCCRESRFPPRSVIATRPGVPEGRNDQQGTDAYLAGWDSHTNLPSKMPLAAAPPRRNGAYARRGLARVTPSLPEREP